ncbi:hypothetical protein K456DRAFT_1180979 [Colletotrichum gloeosporioides 23]|nr:hypothetical protein K456DRAFT_1180979 [Colletotrichum gloeosporioides 23]
MLNEQSSVNISCFEDENWDEYGVNDALRHNLLADGTDTLHSVATSSEWQSKLPSQSSWDTDNPSIEDPSSSSSPSRTSTTSEPTLIQPAVNTWITTVDDNYYSLPFDVSEQSYEPSTSSPARKRSLRSLQPRPAEISNATKGSQIHPHHTYQSLFHLIILGLET